MSTYTLSARGKALREAVLSGCNPYRDEIGQILLTRAKQKRRAQNGYIATREGARLSYYLETCPPLIHPQELIVGFNYYEYGEEKELTASLPTEEAKRSMRDYLKQGLLSEDEIQYILDTFSGPAEPPETAYWPEMAPEVKAAADDGAIMCYCINANHTVLDYEKVVRIGFEGICQEIEEQLSDFSYQDSSWILRRPLLEAAKQVAESAGRFGMRYAGKARELASSCQDPVQKAEYLSLVPVLEQVPRHGARTFHEAVQALWFAHIFNTWEDGINANSLGRLDQILYPYYQRDMEAGRITKEEAYELLVCLWIKLYRDYDVQQCMVGGVDSDGSDATNELSYMMLEVTKALGFIRCLSVRYHAGAPDDLLALATEVVGMGKGVPFFFNDDVLIPALTDKGIPLADARGYAAIGCVEITIPGKANPHAVSHQVNLLKALEYALNDGKSMVSGLQIGPHTGDPAAFTGFDDLMAAYKTQAQYIIDLACHECSRLELIYAQTVPQVYKSMLTEGCLESGRNFNAGGALYHYHESDALGIPNVADSLASIRKFVFEDGQYSIGALVRQLLDNLPDESMRLELINRSPKYGNDDDSVDSLARDVAAHFCQYLERQRSALEGQFFPQLFSFLWLLSMGSRTAASADGRRKGDPLAYSVSPMQGRDHSGLSAMLNSLAKLPHHMAAGSTSAIIEVEPMLFQSDHLNKMQAAIKAAFRQGVGQMQFNVVDAKTLENAQRAPQEYRNLSVRVSGFSQKFCLLDKGLQDHIIARTKHSA